MAQKVISRWRADEDLKLPLEHFWREALLIYGMRLVIFFVVVLANFLLPGLIFLAINNIHISGSSGSSGSYTLFFLLVILLILWITISLFRRGAGSSKEARRREEAIKTKNFGKYERDVIDGKIVVGMTDEMVVAAWGEPTDIAQPETTKTNDEMVLAYGNPDKESGANFIMLRDGVVAETHINQPRQITRSLPRSNLILIAILIVVWGVLFCLFSTFLG